MATLLHTALPPLQVELSDQLQPRASALQSFSFKAPQTKPPAGSVWHPLVVHVQ
jgi:hypothetical protein